MLLHEQGGKSTVWGRIQFISIRNSVFWCASADPNDDWSRVGLVVITVTTKTAVVVYGTEVIHTLFLYALYLTSAFSIQTNSVPVYVSHSVFAILCYGYHYSKRRGLHSSHFGVCQHHSWLSQTGSLQDWEMHLLPPAPAGGSALPPQGSPASACWWPGNRSWQLNKGLLPFLLKGF